MLNTRNGGFTLTEKPDFAIEIGLFYGGNTKKKNIRRILRPLRPKAVLRGMRGNGL